MRRIQKAMKWLTAFMLISLLMLLSWHCIDIYLAGSLSNMPSEVNLNGQMYRWDDVQSRLASLFVPFVLAVLVSAVAAVVCRREDGTYAVKSSKKLYQRSNKEDCPVIRIALLTLAVVFIVLGAMNGGLRDVLVKAINICTECIGLG